MALGSFGGQELFDELVEMTRRQAAFAANVESAPRVVFLLWQDTTLLGVCGTEARANREISDYNDLRNEAGCESVVVRIEKRVVFS